MRIQGGWKGVKELRAAGANQKRDEGILGKEDFVTQALADSQEKFERKYRLGARRYTLDRLIERVAEPLGMSSEKVIEPGKGRPRVETRSLLCYRANTTLGLSQAERSRRLPLNQPAVSIAVRMGAHLAREQGHSVFPQE